MAHLNFTVDTSEMARSLHGVAPHVDGTTAAVVAMQSAVVIAERKAAEQICENVDRGFFSLIRSQISQKLAICKSQMDARIMELANQAHGLTSIRGRMERDFQMIAQRYGKLFRTLDRALLVRIGEIDSSLIGFTSRDMDHLRNRARSIQATVPVHQAESILATQQIATSQAKASTVRAIDGMRRFVGEANQQRFLVSSVLSETALTSHGHVFLPVLFLESDSLRGRQPHWQFCTPSVQESLKRRLGEAVEREVREDAKTLGWRPATPEERERVGSHFLQMAQSSQVSARTRELMVKMFRASNWQTLDKASA